MTESEIIYIEKDLKSLFPNDTLTHNNQRHYSNFVIAKNTNYTIGFNKDLDTSIVEYNLIKEVQHDK